MDPSEMYLWTKIMQINEKKCRIKHEGYKRKAIFYFGIH
jgi:hypothetical protein